MKHLFFNIFKFTVFFLSIFLVISLVNYKFTYRSNYYKLPKTTKYVIFGDSHGECSINGTVENMENLSQSAEVYKFTFHKIEKVLERNNINTIFIDFCNSQVDAGQDSIIWNEAYLLSRYSLYNPLLSFNEVKLIWNKNPSGLLNAHVKTLFKGLYRVLTNNNILNNNFIGGYLFLDRSLTEPLIRKNLEDTNRINFQKKMKISNSNLNDLDRILALCKSKNVKVFLIRCPLHPDWKFLHNENEYQNVLKTRYSDVEYLDFKDFPIIYSERADLEHLNYKGANYFSGFLNELLKNNLLAETNKQTIINNEIRKRKKNIL